MKDVNKTLFSLFTKHKCDNFELYNEILTTINQHTTDTIGKVDCEFYEILVKLHNSENNANWENRHKDRIQYLWQHLWQQMSNIEDRSGEYLP